MEGSEEANIEQKAELQATLAANFKLGAVDMRRALWVCAEGQKTTRIARVTCLESCLAALESVVAAIDGKVEEATELLGRRAERVRVAREELHALN